MKSNVRKPRSGRITVFRKGFWKWCVENDNLAALQENPREVYICPSSPCGKSILEEYKILLSGYYD